MAKVVFQDMKKVLKIQEKYSQNKNKKDGNFKRTIKAVNSGY